MDKNKIIEACKEYDSFLEKKGIKPNRENDKPSSLSHLRFMVQEIPVHLENGKVEKAHRWLGFVQGSFWVLELYKVEDMKGHNRSD